MIDKKGNMRRMQLADALRVYPSPSVAVSPGGGWIRAIREALGMTQTQLSERLQMSRQSVQDFEKAEAEQRITLESLEKVARAMGCRLVYSLVPESGSLDNFRQQQANALAAALLKPAEHSMKLEAQGVSQLESERQRKLLADELLQGNSRKLWQ